VFKNIYKSIKKSKKILIARHVNPDPDCISSSLGLCDLIKLKFPNKEVHVIGANVAKFKFIGTSEKMDESLYDADLLIVVDTPDMKRIDGIDISRFNNIIKIDHHPLIDNFGGIEYIDDKASSCSEIIIEMCQKLKLPINGEIAEKLYVGVISDNGRFLYNYTTIKSFELVTWMLKTTNIDFGKLYEPLYLRSIKELQLQSYLVENMIFCDNGFGYIKLTKEALKELEIDASLAGHLVGEFVFIDELLCWAIFVEDEKSGLIRAHVRSRGPIINKVLETFNGGGHAYAGGARISTWDEIDNLVYGIKVVVNEYKK